MDFKHNLLITFLNNILIPFFHDDECGHDDHLVSEEYQKIQYIHKSGCG